LSFSAIFFDVDDVMLDMDRIAHLGVEAVLEPLAAELGEARALAVRASLGEGYATLIRQLRSGGKTELPEYAALKAKIAHWQRGVTEAGYELKMFSRHSLLAIALEQHGHRVTEALVNAALDRYWQVLTGATEMFADARAVIARLRAEGTPFLLATNSDGFLLFDEAAQTFRYDPADAVKKKLARLAALRAVGIEDAQITVGDPIGKPDPRFYQRVVADFERFYGGKPDLSRALAVGDSLNSDVLPFLQLGVGYGAWLQRERKDPPLLQDRVATLSDLHQLEVLWPG
jgi:FMN phosphatase YigB (HAD superfamily)